MPQLEIPRRPKRIFLKESFLVTSWSELKPYFDDLLARSITSSQALKDWFRDRSELESANAALRLSQNRGNRAAAVVDHAASGFFCVAGLAGW